MSECTSNDQCATCQERALFNPLILENLFKFLSSKQLSRCRLVCKFWHYVSLPFWCELAGPITLYENARDAVFEKNTHMTLFSFMDMYKKNSRSDKGQSSNSFAIAGWPYRRFQLLFFHDLCFNQTNSMQDFWMYCGQWIAELQIFGCQLSNSSAYKDVLLCKHTPNVKKLKFSCQCPHFVNEHAGRETLAVNTKLESLSFFYCMPKVAWIELFSHYPSMKNFQICSPYRLINWENELVGMTNAIKTLRMKDEKILCSLKSLNIHIAGVNVEDRFRNQSISISSLLKGTKLPLESISCDASLFRGEENSGELESLLSMYQLTLKSLKIRDSLCELPIQFPSLTLTSLKELTLVGKSFVNASILKFTPNLTLLHVTNPWRSRAPDRYMLRGFIKSPDHIKLPFLRDFRYDFDSSPCTVLNLVCWMPNVETLEMPLTNETFRIVCKHWGKLKHLVVQKDVLDDDGICGVVVGNDDKLKNEKFADHQLAKPQPDITDLQDLRTFVMENHRHNRNEEMEDAVSATDMLPTKLTEKSILHGFMKLPRLHKLNITVEGDTLSGQLLENMKNKIVEVNVIQMYHPYRYNPFN